MIQSMTGYGAAQTVADGTSYAVEIRCVNHRYLKLAFKLPEHLQLFESGLDKLLRKRIARGSVTCSLRVRNESGGGARPINRAALAHYIAELQATRAATPDCGTIDLATLALLPGVCEAEELSEEDKRERWPTVERLANEALDAAGQLRRNDGVGIDRDIREHVAGIRVQLDGIAERAPQVIDEYHERLRTRVERLMNNGGFELEADGLMREVAIYAERCDITEEISRLTSHLDQCIELCERGGQVGRTLDFLTQEMLREANTIASKSNDAGIARSVVEIKGLIDRVKEQVQNVE